MVLDPNTETSDIIVFHWYTQKILSAGLGSKTQLPPKPQPKRHICIFATQTASNSAISERRTFVLMTVEGCRGLYWSEGCWRFVLQAP